MQNFAKCSNILNIFKNKSTGINFSTNCFKYQLSRPVLRAKQTKKPEDHKITPFGWVLLIIPAATFSLGVWQIQRKKWKEGLISEMKESINSIPIELPRSLDDIKKLEYKTVRVRGHFLHDKEMYMGPRSLLVEGDASTQSSLITNKTNVSQGYLVVTPFKLADRDETILVNRGWVPMRNRDQRTREEGQIQGDVDLIGIVRLHENRPVFSIKNQQGSNTYFYRDLEKMSQISNSSPIFLDATADFEVKGGPVPGQTRVSLRNEHLSYIITWFSLCGFTSLMWYKMVFRGK